MKKGYQIIYDQVGSQKHGKDAVRFLNRLGIFTVLCTLLFLLCVCPDSLDRLTSLLIPGDDQTTVLALEHFTQKLEQSGTLAEALDAFCRTVIDAQG